MEWIVKGLLGLLIILYLALPFLANPVRAGRRDDDAQLADAVEHEILAMRQAQSDD